MDICRMIQSTASQWFGTTALMYNIHDYVYKIGCWDIGSMGVQQRVRFTNSRNEKKNHTIEENLYIVQSAYARSFCFRYFCVFFIQ